SYLINHQSPIPADYTCKGRNISPALHIEGAPPDTKSMTLIMHDPDAPNGDFTHWVVWNIPPETTDILDGSVPDTASEGISDFETVGYGGPCPPAGTHQYVFDLYALDTAFTLPQGASRPDIEAAIRGHVLAQTQLIGLVAA
ncbi:MAG: YbhB/YbcL family Raf kinase inhibitor-like protein, partial [Patescibacteria group bacterium]